MFSKFLFPKLSEAESFTIETKLTKTDAIEKLKNVTGEPWSISNIGSYFMRDDPLFRGKVDEDGFELLLFRDVTKFSMSNYSPPAVKGRWQGEKSVTIQADIAFSTFHKAFIKLTSVFDFLFIAFVFLIPQIGLGTAYFESVQNTGDVSDLDWSLGKYLMLAMLAVLFSCLVSIILRLVFFASPILLMNRGMRYSKEAFLNLFN